MAYSKAARDVPFIKVFTMNPDILEAPQPCEQNSNGDKAGQNLLKDCDMKGFVLLNDKDFATATGQAYLPDMMLINSGDKFDPKQLGDLTGNVLDLSPHNPRAAEHVKQIQNAERHLPGLHRRSDLREGEEMINEGNLEEVRRKVEATNNPKLKEWFEKRYPKA